MMSCPYQGIGNPTLDVSTCLLVGFMPLGSEGAHKAIYDGLCLRNQIFSNISDERGKVMVLLEASLQVL